MKSAPQIVLFSFGISMAGLAQAAESGEDVVKTKGCLACHAVDQKKVGPAFKEVAAKYKGDKSAEATLVAKLKEGKGHPKIAAADAELNAVIRYVLR